MIERTAETIVGEATQKARNLSISEGIPTDETIEEILAHASSNAEGLNSQVDLDSVDLEESEDSKQEDTDKDETEESEEDKE